MLTESKIHQTQFYKAGSRNKTDDLNKSPARLGFKSFHTSKATKSFYTSDTTRNVVKKMLDKKIEKTMGEECGAIFETAFSLILTVVLRPIATLLMPNCDKRDKQYAAAQSMASGLVGFGTTWAIFKPITKANKWLNTDIKPIVKNKELAAEFGELIKEGDEILPISKRINSALKNSKVPEVKKKLEGLSTESLMKKLDDVLWKNTCKEDHPEIYKKLTGIKDPVKKLKELGKIVKNLEKSVEEKTKKINPKFRHFIDAGRLGTYERWTGQGFRLVTMPLIGFMTIGLISPLMKKIFPKKQEALLPNKSFETNQQFIKNSPLNNTEFKDNNPFDVFSSKQKLLRRGI